MCTDIFDMDTLFHIMYTDRILCEKVIEFKSKEGQNCFRNCANYLISEKKCNGKNISKTIAITFFDRHALFSFSKHFHYFFECVKISI